MGKITLKSCCTDNNEHKAQRENIYVFIVSEMSCKEKMCKVSVDARFKEMGNNFFKNLCEI
jgi:hypothetical protein